MIPGVTWEIKNFKNVPNQLVIKDKYLGIQFSIGLEEISDLIYSYNMNELSTRDLLKIIKEC